MYQLQHPIRAPPGIANIYEIHIPNKIVRNNHHINLPSLQRDQFSLQEETRSKGQNSVLKKVKMSAERDAGVTAVANRETPDETCGD